MTNAPPRVPGLGPSVWSSDYVAKVMSVHLKHPGIRERQSFDQNHQGNGHDEEIKPKMSSFLLSIFVLFLTIRACYGFTHHKTLSFSVVGSSNNPSRTTLHSIKAFDSSDSRVDIRNLLTQRAIQSFIFLCESVRDPHSGKWIEDFLEAPNQLQYHGTGAGYIEKFGGTWDAPLLAMMEREKDVVVVSAKRSGKGHKGWSKNNPYIEDRYVEFHIDIDPVSLTSRILSVREQIAKEWEADLGILSQANKNILESYAQISREERGKRDAELLSRPPVAFERTAMVAINQQVWVSASPFRNANFDLLCNLCTQASVHRLLRRLQAGGREKAFLFDWLRDFYSERVTEYFDGNQRFGRADDFLEELLLETPAITKASNGNDCFVDPMRLAEDIIQIRNDVVEEWKVTMTEVPQAHSASIRKTLLEKQMANWGSREPLGGEASSSSFE
jgi:hypothetical protein